MTLDELINSAVVCGDHVTVVSTDDDAQEVVHFDDYTEELDRLSLDGNDEILSWEVTIIEARKIKGRTTLLITVADR